MADTWIPIDRGAEGLQILDDGTLLFSALRAQQLTYIVQMDPAHPTKILSLKHKKIRLTVAIPLDHHVKAAYKLPGNPTSTPTGPVAHADDIAPGVRRQYALQAGENYKRWLRKDSWPVPASIANVDGSARQHVTDKPGSLGIPAQALRDDTKYLMAQAYRKLSDVGRAGGQKSIFLKGIINTINPGDLIWSIGGAIVSKCVLEVTHHMTGTHAGKTECVLG